MGKGGDGQHSSGPMLRVAIAGAGFSGPILARQLMRKSGAEVVCFEKIAQKSVWKHWTQPVTIYEKDLYEFRQRQISFVIWLEVALVVALRSGGA